MESATHRHLKRLAVAFLRERDCRIVATEVACPFSRYRIDVAGYGEIRDRGERRVWTAMVECKQSRSDFLRDARSADRLIRDRASLDRLRQAWEEKRLKPQEPELRRSGTALFAELEEWDFTASREPGYQRLLRRLRKIDAKLYGETKFCMAARYRLADRLYVVSPAGLLRRRDLPMGWGLLEAPRRALADDDPNGDLFGESRLRMRVRSASHPSQEKFRQRLLRNIAIAASNATARSMGVL